MNIFASYLNFYSLSMKNKIVSTKAEKSHVKYSKAICDMIEQASIARGTGIAKRKPEYIASKITEGKAVLAIHDKKIVGFCYIEDWQKKQFVANSGLIVHPDYRHLGLAKKIKKAIFNLSKNRYPNAKLFGITTSLAVMRINSELGYKPVTFSELTQDNEFWAGCEACRNYEVLQRTNKKMCYCTAMVCDLSKYNPEENNKNLRWERFKDFLKMRKKRIKKDPVLMQDPNIFDIIHLDKEKHAEKK